MGNNPEIATVEYESSLAIPNMGVATSDSAATCEEYLVTRKDEKIQTRVLRGKSGHLYLVDQLANPNSITFSPGGFRGSVLLHGRVATVSDEGDAKDLMNAFAREIRRSFRKVRAFWVGPEAETLLDSGVRLTMSVHAAPEFDLSKESPTS
jgi:hypothetical protein